MFPLKHLQIAVVFLSITCHFLKIVLDLYEAITSLMETDGEDGAMQAGCPYVGKVRYDRDRGEKCIECINDCIM